MSRFILAHRIALDPNREQRRYFAQACGVARFAYNWGLAEWKRMREAGEKPTAGKLAKKLNAIKGEQFPWMYDVTKCAPQHALIALGKAFERFFKHIAAVKAGAKDIQKVGYPQFKRKHAARDSFRADNGPLKGKPTFKVEGKCLWLPRIGWVRMHEALRFDGKDRKGGTTGRIRPLGKLLSVTVSRTGDRWFASITVELVDYVVPARENQAVGGVDLGITTLATLHDGTKVDGPRALRKELTKLRRLNRSLSRKKKFSKNWQKAKQRLARHHQRIKNLRRDSMHKLTTGLIREFTVLGIEDLNVRGMLQNRRLARSVGDAGFYEFRRQLEYKAALYGSQVFVAERWFASSKTCSCCGVKVAELPLKARQWSCSACGTQHDRDVNAAINLRNMAASSAATACGAGGSGPDAGGLDETNRDETGTSS